MSVCVGVCLSIALEGDTTEPHSWKDCETYVNWRLLLALDCVLKTPPTQVDGRTGACMHLGRDVCTWGSKGGGDAPGGAHLGL